MVLTVTYVAFVITLVYSIASAVTSSTEDTSWLLEFLPIYASFGGLIVLFLISISLRYELTTVDGDPRAVLADLAHRLRVSRYRVKEDKKGLKVQITSSTAIRITAGVGNGRTVMRYKPDQTASGWAALIILLFIYYFIPISVAIAIYAVWEVQRFAERAVLPRVIGALPIAGEKPADAIRSTLIDGLSEGYRLAAEAYEAQRSNIQDGILAVFTGSLFVWFLTFMGFVEMLKNQPMYHDFLTSLIVSLIVTITFCIPPMIYLTRDVKARALEFKSWSDRLLVRLGQETGPEPPKDVEPSVFELLDDTSRQIPKWMKVMRRAGLFTDAWTWFVIFMLAYVAFMLFLGGISWYPPNLIMQAILVSGALATTLCCYLLYRRWITEAREEESAVATNWETRLRTVRENMQNHLEGL